MDEVVIQTDIAGQKRMRGKVRDIYELGDRLLIVVPLQSFIPPEPGISSRVRGPLSLIKLVLHLCSPLCVIG